MLDWVPGHFPTDAHGLGRFDGTALYEHADPRQGLHQRLEHADLQLRPPRGRQLPAVATRSSGCASIHIDGLRVDAVASMLYLDYCRKAGRMDPERVRRPREPRGDRLPAADERAGLRRASRTPRRSPRNRPPGRWCRGRPMSAGSASASSGTWGGCTTRSSYMRKDPIHRKYHHNELTFGLLYAFTENFILPLSHDEVVHGKGSLLGKMPGDRWQQFANLRAYLRLHVDPSGQEAAVHGRRVRAGARVEPRHRPRLASARTIRCIAGVQRLVRDLNRLYRDDAGAAPARLRAARVSSGSTRNDDERASCRYPAPRPRCRRAGRHRLQLHPGAAPRLPDRRAAAGPLSRAHQHRRARSTAAAASATPAAVDGRDAADARPSAVACG